MLHSGSMTWPRTLARRNYTHCIDPGSDMVLYNRLQRPVVAVVSRGAQQAVPRVSDVVTAKVRLRRPTLRCWMGCLHHSLRRGKRNVACCRYAEVAPLRSQQVRLHPRSALDSAGMRCAGWLSEHGRSGSEG